MTATGTGTAPEDRSLWRRIYGSVREGIILGTYPQGSRLPEQRIAEELHVSRVPLREAVPQLEMEGFVRSFPRRGAVVTTWDSQSIHELFDLRLVLEVGAARYAARRVAHGASTEPLRAALAHSQETVREGDPYRIAQASTWFHEAIADLAGNALLKSAMRSVSGRVMWLFYLTSQLDSDEAFADHAELCEIIAGGNERMAEAIAYAHIERDRLPSFAALHTPA